MRNVRRAADHELLVRLLAEKPHPKTQKSIFPTMRELLCFAATLGFQMDRRVPLSPKTNELDGRVFDNSDMATDIVYLVALAAVRDISVLLPEREDDAVSVFEEYANGGLQVLQEWLAAQPADIDGDQAILGGLRNVGLLPDGVAPIATAIADVKF